MTAIIAYIYKDTAHLVVDSALTMLNPTKKEPESTPFGEAFYIDEDKHVSDGSQKICDLGRGVIGAFAGAVFEGERALDDLHNILFYNSHQTVTKVLLDYFEAHSFTQTNYVFAFYEDGRPKVFYCRNHEIKGFMPDDANCVIEGSVIESFFLHDGFNKIVGFIKANANSAPEALVTIIGIAQLIDLNSPKLQTGVGGTFNGAFVDKLGVNWAKDTAYFIYSSKNVHQFDTFMVSKYNREGLTTVANTKKPLDLNVFASKLALKTVIISEWLEKWKAEIMKLQTTAKADFLVTLSVDRLIITVAGPESIGKDIRISLIEGGAKLSCTQEMGEMMFRTNEVDAPLNPTVWVHFCRQPPPVPDFAKVPYRDRRNDVQLNKV